jgi:ABC-2 type transport system permease protein
MNPTVAWITARGLFGRRRFLLLFPLPVLMIALALVGRASGVSPTHWGPPVIDGIGFTVMLPVIALIVGTGVLGSEIDDGTVTHILAKPLPRREIVLAKLVVAAGVTLVATAVPMFLVGLIVRSVGLGIACGVACALGAVAYSAVFLALSLLTRRPVLVGLLYVLLWEGLLGNLLTGTRILSIHQYVVSTAHELAPTGTGSLPTAHVGWPAALVMTGVFIVGATVVAIDRLRSFMVAGETN